jgi:putative ABC transport system permease protein
MSYALATLWYERQRFLPGVLAVGFSAILMALQCGLLLGLFSITSIPIDHTCADVWVGNPDVLSVDLGRPIPDRWRARVAKQPGVERVEDYLQGFMYWGKPTGGMELCLVIGCHLRPDSLGAVRELTPELRSKLAEPGTVVIDESELNRLGIKGVGDIAEITGRRVRVVGIIRGIKSLAGPFVFCSIETARPLLRLTGDQTTYLLARCRTPEDATSVVQKLRQYPNMSAFTSLEFSRRSRVHWLTKTKAGIAIGYAALLGLLVGAVVTSQTMYAATIASAKEYAVLRALGIPRWRIGGMVLAQAFWVGVVGELVGLPALYLLAWVATSLGAMVQLPGWLLGLTCVVTMGMAMLSGVAALRSLRQIEPGLLLR